MKKKILCVVLLAVMLAGVVTGCKKNAGAVEAYKEFYSEFYDEHLTDDENFDFVDCAAKLVMDGDGKLLLGITDIQSLDKENESNVLLDLYIYEYKRNKVVEKVKISNIKSSDDGVGIATVGDNILVWAGYYDEDDYEHVAFTINGNEYNEVKYDSNNDFVKTGLGEYGTDAGGLTDTKYYSLINRFFSDCEYPVKYCVHGQDFEDWLDYYSQNEVASSLKLDILYAEYLENNRYYEDGEFLTSAVIYWKDGIYYHLGQAGDELPYGYEKEDISVDDEDFLYINVGEDIDPGYLNEKILDNIPSDIDGIKVVVSDEVKDEISQMVNEGKWKQLYVDYVKDKSEKVIFANLVKVKGMDAPLLFYVTNEKTYKLFYIDGSGAVQELLNDSGDLEECKNYYDVAAISFELNSEEYNYEYDDSTGKFVEVNAIELPEYNYEDDYEYDEDYYNFDPEDYVPVERDEDGYDDERWDYWFYEDEDYEVSEDWLLELLYNR